METNKPVTIIISEDDDGHAELIKEALIESGIKNKIIRFVNGEQTWNYLSEEAIPNITQRAFLLLLDINMPIMNGIEVLTRIKENDQLKSMPVVMLTTTDDLREVEQCYQLGCNLYITKPVDFNNFSEKLQRLGLFIQVIRM
jgi:CheY-like chemotaxis protein